MASPAYGPRAVTSDEIKLGPAPQTFALKFITGKDVTSKFPGGRVMFTAVDERKIWLNDEEANEFEHALLDLQIQPADFIRATRVKHGGRGGGYSIRVERVPDEPEADAPAWVGHGSHGAAPSRIEAQLAASIPMARVHGAAAFHAAPEPRRAAASTAAPVQPKEKDQLHSNPTPAPPATKDGTMTGIAAGALMASIDAYLIAVDYATAKGIKVNLALDFDAEDVRQTATSMCIQYWRDGGTRA